MKASPDYDAPCPACSKPIGDHTLRGYAAELRAAGFDYATPHADFPDGPVRVRGVDGEMAGEVKVAAGVIESPIGALPVLRFMFTGPGSDPMSRRDLPPITLVLDAPGLRHFTELVASAVDRAILASAEAR